MRPYTLLSTFTSIIVLAQVHILHLDKYKPSRYINFAYKTQKTSKLLWGQGREKEFYMLLNTFVVNNLLVELLISSLIF